jgi:hypothetical protein
MFKKDGLVHSGSNFDEGRDTELAIQLRFTTENTSEQLSVHPTVDNIIVTEMGFRNSWNNSIRTEPLVLTSCISPVEGHCQRDQASLGQGKVPDDWKSANITPPLQCVSFSV